MPQRHSCHTRSEVCSIGEDHNRVKVGILRFIHSHILDFTGPLVSVFPQQLIFLYIFSLFLVGSLLAVRGSPFPLGPL